MDALRLFQPLDALNRKVQYVVELVDPVTRARLWRRIKVRLEGFVHEPIVNASGRFVWLAEGDAWPAKVVVDSQDPRFESLEVAARPQPPDLGKVKEKDRLQRIELQPTRVYDFGEGVTALRGALAETLGEGADPIQGADVALAWRDVQGTWHAAGNSIKTDARGQFALFVRLPPTPTPDIDKGLLRVRLQFVKDNVGKTTNNFAFLGPTDPPDRVPEGLLLYRDVPLGWAEL